MKLLLLGFLISSTLTYSQDRGSFRITSSYEFSLWAGGCYSEPEDDEYFKRRALTQFECQVGYEPKIVSGVSRRQDISLPTVSCVESAYFECRKEVEDKNDCDLYDLHCNGGR